MRFPLARLKELRRLGLAGSVFVAVLFGTSIAGHAAPPTLEDFGAGSMARSGPAVGEKPLVTLIVQGPGDAKSPFLTNLSGWDSHLWGSAWPRIDDYFADNSRGRFKWKRVGTFGVYNSTGDCTPEGKNKLIRTAVQSADERGDIRLADYDLNGNGRVSHRELGVVVVWNCTNGNGAYGGALRYIDCFEATTASFCGWHVRLEARADFDTAVHEAAHLLGTRDLYNGHCGGSCTKVSVMDRLGGRVFVHLDAPHKMLLGWLNPRIVDLATLPSPGTPRKAFSLAAQPSWSYDEEPLSDQPVLVYDSRRGVDQYFLIEARSYANSRYDTDVAERGGVAVWRLKQTRGADDSGIGILNPQQLGAKGGLLWDKSTGKQELRWLGGDRAGVTLQVTREGDWSTEPGAWSIKRTTIRLGQA